MLALKDLMELDDYRYRVCEVYACEDEAVDIYTTTEDRVIDLCDSHYRMISGETLW